MEKTPLFTEKEYSDTFKLLGLIIMAVGLEANLAARFFQLAAILAIFPTGFFLERKSRLKKKIAKRTKVLRPQLNSYDNSLASLPSEQNLLRCDLLLSTMFLILLHYDLKEKDIQTKKRIEIVNKPREQQATIAIPLPCLENRQVKPRRVEKWERDKDLKNHYAIALDKIITWEKSVN